MARCGSHDKALDALLEKADVYMLSFCGPSRRVQAMKDMQNVRQAHRFSAIQTCSMKSGADGKAAWGIWWGCQAIFDDNNEVCEDCLFHNIEPFAIPTMGKPLTLSHAFLEKMEGSKGSGSKGSGYQ